MKAAEQSPAAKAIREILVRKDRTSSEWVSLATLRAILEENDELRMRLARKTGGSK